jgi:F-type H+-transporting ATPase subunit b
LHDLGVDPTVIIVNIVGFLILLWFLKKFLYGPITNMLEVRANEVRSTYDAAEAEKAAMEQLRMDYEKRLAGIEAEAREKIQAAIKEAQGIRDEIVADARAKADATIERAEAELVREREKTIVALRHDVADLVVTASSRLLEREIDDPAHRKLIDEFISGVGKTS